MITTTLASLAFRRQPPELTEWIEGELVQIQAFHSSFSVRAGS